MGLIVDIVPNHVGVDRPQQNMWWWDVLRHGRNSEYAGYFDIDWDLDEHGRIVLPVLGSDADVADLLVDGDLLRLGSLAFPIAAGTGTGTGAEVHERQHYRLVGWRRGLCGYRRFSRSPRWPGYANRIARFSMPAMSRSHVGSPTDSSMVFVSTTPMGCPIPAAICNGCANWSASRPGL